MRTLPLKGITVIEQGSFITGPNAAMLLADMGAEVIKVERPIKGDPFRAFRGGLYSPHFQAYNRNKKSVTLDTTDNDDLEKFDQLIRQADVYIENFRPGTPERLNIHYERLSHINSRLIYCSITGFGETGPYQKRPVYDTVAQAASGFLGLLINPGNPRVVGPAIADTMTGNYAAMSIMAALLERQQTDAGQRIDISMLSSMCYFNIDAFTHYWADDEIMGPYSRPSVSQSYVMRCADGLWLALHMSSPEKFWQALAATIEFPEMLDDPLFATREQRIQNYELIYERLGQYFAKHPRAYWLEQLTARDVPHSPLYHIDEVVNDAQVKDQKITTTSSAIVGDQPWHSIRFPAAFHSQPVTVITAPPTLGQHNAEFGIDHLKEDQPMEKTMKQA